MAKQGGFFVRLCYGYVGKYKDTSKMTAKEVIEEFLKRKGVSSPREFFDNKFAGLRQSGATSGANNGAYALGLPPGMTPNALLEALRLVCPYEKYLELVERNKASQA